VRVAATEDVPVHPALAEAIAALSASGFWACAYDCEWRMVAETPEQSAVRGGSLVGDKFQYGPDALNLDSPTEPGIDVYRASLRRMVPWILADLGVDRERLREIVHPALRDVVDELVPSHLEATTWTTPNSYLGEAGVVATAALRVRDANDHVVGTVHISKPNVGMNTIALLTWSGDLDHLQRMHSLSQVRRRPAAVLFADLEGSAQLSKRMPTAAYFTLIRRMTREADTCVINEGGLVGRHVGDGAAAFFVADTTESESTTARACIAAARALQTAMLRIADRHELPAADVTIRAGLHWGSKLHIGSIITLGRTEVTALGDEVNEAARIEACATGGRILASKDLIERLDPDDAAALDLDPHRISYTQLGDLDAATDKARRDAPAIPVCDIAETAR
jgi:class 3 adenylate cyclase